SGPRRRAGYAAPRLAVRAHVLGHHHQQATRLVEDHPVQMLIHGNFLSYNRIPGRLDRPVQIETAGNIGGAELRGLVERRRDKAFVRKTPVTAPYAERPPGEVRAGQLLRAEDPRGRTEG